MSEYKLIPYGISDFYRLKITNKYYVDKTMYIPMVEKSAFNFFVRPRRFGKSLFLNMLSLYYDVTYKDKFHAVYHDTWIGDHPTAEQGKYLILSLNFSDVSRNLSEVEQSFKNHCLFRIDKFVRTYEQYLPKNVFEQIIEIKTLDGKIQFLATELVNWEYKLYIFIDEYDQFANSILMEHGESEYRKITKGESFYKSFFTQLKALTTGNNAPLTRLFITGVSPVTIDDVTSGFNIGKNISLLTEFNSAMGFSESEVLSMINYYQSVGQLSLSTEEAMDTMKKWYDNYHFSNEATESVFNSDAVLYFLSSAMPNKKIPENLIDNNLRMDYKKLYYLVMQDKQLNGNYRSLTEIINEGGVEASVKSSFPYEDIVKRENYISLLYYMGLLTFSRNHNRLGQFLVVPNRTIETLMYEYIIGCIENVSEIKIDIEKIRKLYYEIARNGDIKPFIEFVAEEIKTQTSIRDFASGNIQENPIKVYFMIYFNMYNYYSVITEKELNKGFCDIILEPNLNDYPRIQYEFVIEFKYIKREITKMNLPKAIKDSVAEAKEQLKKYTEYKVKQKKIIAIFQGWELVHYEEE